MRPFFLVPGLVCSTLLLTGALDRQALLDPAAALAFTPQSAETPDGNLLDQAITAYGSDRVRWLEVTVRQTTFGDDAYKAEGRYVLAPDQRLRLELNVAMDQKTGHVLAVSDGQQLRQVRWTDGQAPTECTIALPKNDGNPGDACQAREECLHGQGFGGPVRLLRQIRARLQNPRQQAGHWHGLKIIRVTGSWPADEGLLKTLPPDLRIRHCHVYLDAETLWPHRIDWVGSPRPQDRSVVLLRLEFRDPKLNQPLSAQQSARLFRLSPS